MELSGSRILLTGPTSQVGLPVTLALAAENDVIGIARFSDPVATARLEAAGVECIRADLIGGSLDDVPSDVDFVCNFAVTKIGRWDKDLAANAELIGRLISHCRTAKAVLHCSSTGVYAHRPGARFAEGDALGDNHAGMLPTYSISKIAGETVARFAASEFGVPTTIARLNVPYGDNGGFPLFHLEMILAGQPIPIHPDQPCVYNPIHETDVIASIPKLLDAASVPATTVNWGGDEEVSLEQWAAELGRLVDKPVEFATTESTVGGVAIDLTRKLELLGPSTVDWREGLRSMVANAHPELTLAG
ncbi:MAG: NAD(P)-dependent oxidoreductase [Acidobacteria bacterium]|nr:NAD(P)-dependent oxidoreductase [Acidobacteriota bacterium]